MPTDDLEGLIRRYVQDVWNQADAAALAELTTPDFVYCLGGQPPRDRNAMRQFIAMVHAAFPDWKVNIVECLINAERAAIRWEGQVTHAGPFHGIPPTGKRIAVSGINVYRVRDGKIAAEWEQMDSLGMLAQLGVLKPG